MKRRLAMTILMVVAATLSAVAVDWEELDWSTTVVSDYKTGLPAIVFNAGFAYDEAPDMMELRIEWEVFSVEGGAKTILYEYTTTWRRSGLLRVYLASQSVLIEAGKQYGARVSVEDLENGLSGERNFTYIVPASLPVGLRFVGWDGTEEADLVAMTDAGLQELVILQRAIASYEVVAAGVSISSLFSQHAATDEDYPVSVILLPETGVDNNWGSESEPITVTFGLAVLTFSVPSPSAKSGFQQQLAQQYDQAFVGTVYAGPGGDGLGEGVIVFLHDAMGVILDAAVAELAARSN